jgi:hypothetical protein
MIKNITAGSGLAVTNNHSSWPSFYSSVSGTGNSLVGQMRYNGSSQNIEVYDGNTWITMAGAYPQVELAPHVQAVVVWAQFKMSEESRLHALAAKHPSVADALEAVARAEEQVKIVAALVDTE